MTTDKIIAAAREAGWPDLQLQMASPAELDRLAAFYRLVFQQGMERAAKISMDYYDTYKATKEAHERLSMEPFRPERFGFDLDKLHQCKRIANDIRAHAKNQPESTHDTGNV